MATKLDLEAFEKETLEMREAIIKVAKRKRPVGVAAATHDERLHLAWARDEFEELAPNLRELVEETGVRLPQDLAAMDEALARVAVLKPLMKTIKEELRLLETEVEDTINKHRSEAWKIFSAYYSALSGVVNGNGTLEQKYEPLVELFKLGKRQKAKNSDKEQPASEPVKAKESNG